MNTVKLSALLVAATLSVGALSQAAQAQGKTRRSCRALFSIRLPIVLITKGEADFARGCVGRI